MNDTTQFKSLILKRLSELGQRMDEIDAELGHEMPKDLGDQAVDIEDDQVLEGLGLAARQEVALLSAALKRIEDGTYGICQNCESEISNERLKAVPYAPLCQTCARPTAA